MAGRRLSPRSVVMVLLPLAMLAGALWGCDDDATAVDVQTVNRVTINPANALLLEGEDQEVTVTLTDVSGRVLTDPAVTWSSSSTEVATVSATGSRTAVVTARGPGEATITAHSGAVVGLLGLTVHGVVAEITIVPALQALGLGTTRQLTATLTNARGDTLTGPTITWASGNAALASVQPATGATTSVRPLAGGTVTITATSQSVSATATVTITEYLSNWARISAGEEHTCALTSEGAAYCWGRNHRGQLGNGSTASAALASEVSGSLSFDQLSAGSRHTCALTAAGEAYCWGDNRLGQLGDGTFDDRAVPTRVAGAPAFTAVSAGVTHTCGLTSTGATYCWGGNTNDPVLVDAPMFSQVSAGTYTCGISVAGSAYCWGFSMLGSLGDGTFDDRASPTAVAGGLTFTLASVGHLWGRACALTSAGSAYCWGMGALGDATTGESPVPIPVSGGLAFALISAGDAHTCGLAPGGTAYCWGSGFTGALGDGTYADHPTPHPVAGGMTFSAIAAGGVHTCGITTAGRAYCWGDNDSGQLGDGTTTARPMPVGVLGGNP